MLKLLPTLGWIAIVFANEGQTDVTEFLNSRIAKDDNCVYCGGQGVLVRTPDFFDSESTVVVPATFWTNDIYAPSALYPTKGSPFCPNQDWDGFQNLDWFMYCEGQVDIWQFAIVGYVVAGAMSDLYPDFDGIQSADWGWGVFYATDSNAADSRCVWRENALFTGYDCPGGWIDTDGTWFADTVPGDHEGAGGYPMGNPDTKAVRSFGGGGAGCHLDKASGAIDQQDAFDQDGNNLVKDADCQCNYAYSGNWEAWVDNWKYNTQQKDAFVWRNWLAGGGGLAPSWALDSASCWVSNPRDMIQLQNALYWDKWNWNNQQVPVSDWSSGMNYDMRKYWGWNEVPVTKDVVNNVLNWDAVMVKLPADLCGRGAFGGDDTVNCLDSNGQWQLENDIDAFVANQVLFPGGENAGNRPGSYIVFVREYGIPYGLASVANATARWQGINWQRYFFCEDWFSPSGKYKVVFMDKSSDPDGRGACYVDWGTSADAALSI